MLEILAEGEILEGWETVSVSKLFTTLPFSFSVTSGSRSGGNPLRSKLIEGTPVELVLDGESIMQGYVEKRRHAYDASSNLITASGRDRSGDLVDCSAVNVPGHWRGARVATIASEIVGLFPGLRFREDLSSPNLSSLTEFSLETGETAFSALSKVGLMSGHVLRSDGMGNVFYTIPGRQRAPVSLQSGVNIHGGTLEAATTGRFSRYILHSQDLRTTTLGKSRGNVSTRAEVEDLEVGRVRPIMIEAERAGDQGSMEERAKFERNLRAADSTIATYSLPGWDLQGYRWRDGDLIPVFDDELGIGTLDSPLDLLIAGVTWETSAMGATRAEVQLRYPGTFSTLPPPVKQSGGPALFDFSEV